MKLINGVRVPLGEEQFLYPETAKFYDEHARRFMGPVYRRFAARAAALKLPGNRVLDIGAGSGLLSIELAKVRPDFHITAIDISEEMLKLARLNAARAGLTARIDFRQAPAAALPFSDSSFDLVASNTSLHLWAAPHTVFREIARVTAPGGCLLLWDNLRSGALGPIFSLTGWLLGMNKSQRSLWLRAIRSSYTLGEARAILKESTLKDARVSCIPRFFMLGVAWKKTGF